MDSIPFGQKPIDMIKTPEQVIVDKMRPEYMTIGDIASFYGVSKLNCEFLLGKPCLRVTRGNRTRLWKRSRVLEVMGIKHG